MLYIPYAAAACLIERYFGYPAALFRLFGHPVQWMGDLIAWLDATLNTKPDDEVEGLLRGGLALLLLLAATALPAYMLQDLLHNVPGGAVINILIATAGAALTAATVDRKGSDN